jgi:RNA polymerase sigma-70 factor (ECF subfamily)
MGVPVGAAAMVSSALLHPRSTVDTAPLSFEEVYRASFDFVWRALRGMQVPEHALEDAAQEVFVVVLRRLPAFDGRSSVRTWLFEIALNVARNVRRSARRKGRSVPLDEELAADSASPAAEAENRRALELVLAVMETLDEDQRIVLFLTEVEQLTSPEIAELVGANVNTVSTRLRRRKSSA